MLTVSRASKPANSHLLFAIGFAAISSIVCATTATAIPQKSNKSAQNQSVITKQSTKNVNRTLVFPRDSIGGLYLIGIGPDRLWHEGSEDEAAVAKGTVKLSVPSDRLVVLKANANLVAKPEQLDKLSPDIVDSISIAATPIDETEDDRADEVLSHVARLTGLKEVKLNQVVASDNGLAKLKVLKNLVTLKADIGNAHGSCLKELSSLPKLTTLDLSANPLESKNLKPLADFPSLKRLIVRHASLDEEAAKYIGQCKQLDDVSLAGNHKINDKAMPYLAKISTLTKLDLSDTSVTAKGLAELHGLNKLERLSVSERYVFKRQLPELAKILPHTIISIEPIAGVLKPDMNRLFAPLPK
ncbi:MAG TPA: hypothetical protein V6C86_01400 [Oculatellaceae cyanobacterium]